MAPTTPKRHARRSLAARARHRALLLAIVWTLPGICCAAHQVFHALESEHHELHAAASVGHHLTGMSHDHDHGHTHPETPPVLSPESAKKLDTAALLTAALEVDASPSAVKRLKDAPVLHAARRAATVSGPRAPPIA